MSEEQKQIRVKVDREACQTAAICLMYQLKEEREMYVLDDDSIAEIKTEAGESVSDEWVDLNEVAGYDPQNHAKMREIALESAKNCPFNAILVEEGGKVIWPEEL